jgi:hypothetical protein
VWVRGIDAAALGGGWADLVDHNTGLDQLWPVSLAQPM